MTRTAVIARKTKETNVRLRLNLDGAGAARVKTTLPFLDHMLSLTAKHGLMDLDVIARGDTQVDAHHLVEDLGICLGQALAKALGTKVGITRFAAALVPMDEALARVVVDLSGRPALVYGAAFKRSGHKGEFDFDLLEDFLGAVTTAAGMNLHVRVEYGRNNHHIAEAIFKAFGRAIGEAAARNPRVRGVPSTKGRL